MKHKLHSKHEEDLRERYNDLHISIKQDVLTHFIIGSTYEPKYWDTEFFKISVRAKNILSMIMWFDVVDECQELFIKEDFTLKVYEFIADKVAVEEVDAAKDIAFDLAYDRDFNNAV